MAKPTTTRKPRTAVPADETKAQKFSRLASARVSKAVKQIQALGNLSGSGYESTPEQRTKIETVIREATVAAIAKLNKTVEKSAEPAIKI